MKTLICLLGNIRGTEIAWNSLINNVVIPNNADLALCIHKISQNDKKTILHNKAKFIWEFEKYNTEDWGIEYDKIAKNKEWRKVLNFKCILWGGIVHNGTRIEGSGSIIYLFRHLLKKNLINHNILSEYDNFIITRTDHFYASHPLVKNLDMSKIWIPNGEDWGGICDRHVIINKKYVIDYLSPFDKLITDTDTFIKKYHLPNLHYVQYKHFHLDLNTERFLKTYLEDTNMLEKVERFPRTFFIIKEEHDPTSWIGNFHGIFIKELNLFSKYKEEFFETVKNSNTTI